MASRSRKASHPRFTPTTCAAIKRRCHFDPVQNSHGALQKQHFDQSDTKGLGSLW